MNHNNSVRNNQAFSKEYLSVVYALGGVLPDNHSSEPLSQRRYTPKRIKIIRIILNHINNNKITRLSHIGIAAACHLSRRAVLEAFKIFEEDELFEIEHRSLSHDTNIYRLGNFFKTREVIYALKDIFKNLYRAFCRTLEYAYNAVAERNNTRNLKTHITLSFDNKKRVVFGTNTNTTLSYIRKICNKVSSVFLVSSKFNALGFKELTKRDKEMEEKQQWLKSADGKTWINKRKEQHATWGLTEKEKAVAKKEPVPSRNEGKISSALMQERERLCAYEPDLHRRLAMLERLKSQVKGESVPYITRLIQKTLIKIENQNV